MTRTNSFELRRVSERVASAAAAIAMTALLAIASDARAADSSVQLAPTVKVSYSAVDLATDEGAADVYRKLKRAARSVCDAYGGNTLERKTVAQKCYEKSLESAVYRVNAQRLTTLHAAATRDLG